MSHEIKAMTKALGGKQSGHSSAFSTADLACLKRVGGRALSRRSLKIQTNTTIHRLLHHRKKKNLNMLSKNN